MSTFYFLINIYTGFTSDLNKRLEKHIEPIILGKGISIFEGKIFESNLKLIGQKMITKNEIQLHYKILKK